MTRKMKTVTIDGANFMLNDWGNLMLKFLFIIDEQSYSIQHWPIKNSDNIERVIRLMESTNTSSINNVNGKKVRIIMDGHAIEDILYLEKNKSILSGNAIDLSQF